MALNLIGNRKTAQQQYNNVQLHIQTYAISENNEKELLRLGRSHTMRQSIV